MMMMMMMMLLLMMMMMIQLGIFLGGNIECTKYVNK